MTTETIRTTGHEAVAGTATTVPCDGCGLPGGTTMTTVNGPRQTRNTLWNLCSSCADVARDRLADVFGRSTIDVVWVDGRPTNGPLDPYPAPTTKEPTDG